MAEQLICNQQVDGSTPFTSSNSCNIHMGDFPSGQRGQTVNLLSTTSLVRIQHPPPEKQTSIWMSAFLLWGMSGFGQALLCKALVRSFAPQKLTLVVRIQPRLCSPSRAWGCFSLWMSAFLLRGMSGFGQALLRKALVRSFAPQKLTLVVRIQPRLC